MLTQEWWLWVGDIWDVTNEGFLRNQGPHFELYAVRLEDGTPTACAGPVNSGMAPFPGPASRPAIWPTGKKGNSGKRGNTLGDDCPFLSQSFILAVLNRRIDEFTRFPHSDTFPPQDRMCLDNQQVLPNHSSVENNETQ